MASKRTQQVLARLADLTPRMIVSELDRYIIGQADAKKAVAIALRNRWRRQRAPESIRDEISPNNIILIGPTGVGKTEIARRLAKLSGAPFLKVEASKFTEVGYIGRDVESMVRDLVESAVELVRSEREAEVEEVAHERVDDRILDLLLPAPDEWKPEASAAGADLRAASSERAVFVSAGAAHGNGNGTGNGNGSSNGHGSAPSNGHAIASSNGHGSHGHGAHAAGSLGLPTTGFQVADAGLDATAGGSTIEAVRERHRRTRDKLRNLLLDGQLEERDVEVEVEQRTPATTDLFAAQGAPDAHESLAELLHGLLPKRTRKRTVRVAEARRILLEQEMDKLIDLDDVSADAVERTEAMGIIFLDEIDKIAGERGQSGGPDVSREGVQRDLLPIVEGSTVQTKYGMVKTDHVLFVAAGAFHVSKPSDLIPELQGRFPIRVELKPLTEGDFVRIMTEPENALTKQYAALVAAEGATLDFTDGGVAEVARTAARLNERMENIGARRLHTVMTTLLEEAMFALPDGRSDPIVVDSTMVRDRLKLIAEDEDLRKYIL